MFLGCQPSAKIWDTEIPSSGSVNTVLTLEWLRWVLGMWNEPRVVLVPELSLAGES
jgi:hypothetical protein